MSRKRVSTALKRLRSTERKDRALAVDPLATTAPLTSDPVPPELADNPDAIAEWRQVLSTARHLRAADRSTLLGLCLSWARHLRADRASRESDLTVLRGSGGRGIHPSVTTAQREMHCISASRTSSGSRRSLAPTARSTTGR